MTASQKYYKLREDLVSDGKKYIEDIPRKELRDLAIAKWRTFPSVTLAAIVEESEPVMFERFMNAYANEGDHAGIVADILIDAFTNRCGLWESLQSDLDIVYNDMQADREIQVAIEKAETTQGQLNG